MGVTVVQVRFKPEHVSWTHVTNMINKVTLAVKNRNRKCRQRSCRMLIANRQRVGCIVQLKLKKKKLTVGRAKAL